MRTADVFEGFDQTLWSRLVAEPVVRVDSGRRGADLVIEVELAPGVDPRGILVLREERALVLVWADDRAVLRRIPLDASVGRPTPRSASGRLLVSAPLVGPAPVSIEPALRSRTRLERLRAALGRLGARIRSLFAG
ncbi:hypothetical protein [Nocardiopsis alkaliphila]|uniref:hypothetical protein n=1 Tax=Nocardiopsis alkaliphila TaxID=225762 RepID=UPI00034CA225|nr:hypothetical protein [Nocardiopsis alkaliphila]